MADAADNSTDRWKRRAMTALIAAAGVGAFAAAGLPLPFLFGPMGACLLSALLGARLMGFGQVSVAARTVLGVAVGASLTPDVVAGLPRLAGSLALVPLFIALIAAAGVPFFLRVWKLDPITSFYAAMPGGLQDMVIFGTEAGGDPRALSLIHATRVLLIVTVAPILLVKFYGGELSQPIGEPASAMEISQLLLMAGAALVGWKVGERVGLFGASILGPMILTTLLTVTGLIHTRPPAEAILAAQFFIGSAIGVYFVGVTLRELRRVVAAGLTYVVLLAALTAIFSQIVSRLGLGRPLEAFLAFAPGGQAEMTVLAIVSGADLGFVVAHHLTRIVLVITGAPILAAWIARARPRR